jgi:hypothetical protein
VSNIFDDSIKKFIIVNKKGPTGDKGVLGENGPTGDTGLYFILLIFILIIYKKLNVKNP